MTELICDAERTLALCVRRSHSLLADGDVIAVPEGGIAMSVIALLVGVFVYAVFKVGVAGFYTVRPDERAVKTSFGRAERLPGDLRDESLGALIRMGPKAHGVRDRVAALLRTEKSRDRRALLKRVLRATARND